MALDRGRASDMRRFGEIGIGDVPLVAGKDASLGEKDRERICEQLAHDDRIAPAPLKEVTS